MQGFLGGLRKKHGFFLGIVLLTSSNQQHNHNFTVSNSKNVGIILGRQILQLGFFGYKYEPLLPPSPLVIKITECMGPLESLYNIHFTVHVFNNSF